MSTIEVSRPASSRWLKPGDKVRNKQQEMDFTYSNMDKLIRLSLGQNANFSNARYDGDYSLTLEQAQLNKFHFICDHLGIQKGTKVIDLGCGWGSFLLHIKKLGAEGTGINLSSAQLAACRKAGLNVHLKDMRFMEPSDFGLFDAVTAIGSFDHLVTVDDYLSGRQDEIYDTVFRHVAGLIPKGARFYMQTMTFSKNMIPYEEVDINAPKDSAAYIVALLTKHFPDSWLPYGGEHVIRTAAPYFKLVHHDSGRLDYIETQKQWWKRIYKFDPEKYLWFLSFLPEFVTNKEFRHQLDFMKVQPLIPCFEREIMDHSRIVFEKI